MSGTVRVATGDFAGRRLVGVVEGTRPATARMRDSIFNRPVVLALTTGRVLDLYAGAGLLGLEALSNGATQVDFVERNRRACDVVRQNLAALGCGERAQVLCMPVEGAVARLEPPYDLCFADPPYDVDATATLDALLRSVPTGLLQPNGLLLWRYLRSVPGPARIAGLARVEERRYGDGVLGTYRAESPGA